jgi:hypothetical protein
MAIITLNNNSLSSVTALPAGVGGKVLQVVQGSTASQVAHTTTYADTGLSASITPSSTSNKVLIIVNQHCYTQGDSGGAVKLLRDSTDIYAPGQTFAFYNEIANSHPRNYHNFSKLDSPSSTSSITYKTQARLYSSNAFRTQDGSHFTSFITLMEVSA